MSDIGDLRIETSSEDGTYVMRLGGELDLGTCPKLERAFERAARSDAEQILVDIVGLDFIDSMGLKTIFLFTRAQGEKIRLRMQDSPMGGRLREWGIE